MVGWRHKEEAPAMRSTSRGPTEKETSAMTTLPVLDHGVLSGIRRTSTPTQRRKEAAAMDRSIDQAVAAVKAERDAEAAAARARYAERTKPVPFTTDELKAARAIRTSVGWHKVAKVNAKSVSVETGYSWTDRYTLDKVLEVAA